MPEDSRLNIVFAGTPDFAAAHLEALLNHNHKIAAVYTQPDRPAGRGKSLRASPVKARALQAGLSVRQPSSLRDAAEVEALRALEPDLMVVVAYGLLLPKEVLETPRLGCINVHASLLPRWRGAAPIQRALEAGDKQTGVAIMQMDEGLDTGPVLLRRECSITPTDTAAQLHDRLAELGVEALLESLDSIRQGTAKATAQNPELATYAPKLSKEEGLVRWADSAERIDLRIRAFNPFPVAFSFIAGQRLRLFAGDVIRKRHNAAPGVIVELGDAIQVACGQDTVFAITQLQLPGKKTMNAREALNGARDLFSLGRAFGNE